MSDAKCLDEIFPSGRGDGRKFTYDGRTRDWYFEPLMKSKFGWEGNLCWVGIVRGEFIDSYSEECFNMKFEEWHPPKTKKKVTMYRPKIKTSAGNYTQPYSWSTDKIDSLTSAWKIVGWESKEIEVDE